MVRIMFYYIYFSIFIKFWIYKLNLIIYRKITIYLINKICEDNIKYKNNFDSFNFI